MLHIVEMGLGYLLLVRPRDVARMTAKVLLALRKTEILAKGMLCDLDCCRKP